MTNPIIYINEYDLRCLNELIRELPKGATLDIRYNPDDKIGMWRVRANLPDDYHTEAKNNLPCNAFMNVAGGVVSICRWKEALTDD